MFSLFDGKLASSLAHFPGLDLKKAVILSKDRFISVTGLNEHGIVKWYQYVI